MFKIFSIFLLFYHFSNKILYGYLVIEGQVHYFFIFFNSFIFILIIFGKIYFKEFQWIPFSSGGLITW